MADYSDLYQNIAAEIVRPENESAYQYRYDKRKFIAIEGVPQSRPTVMIEREITERFMRACAIQAADAKANPSTTSLEDVGFNLDGNHFAVSLRLQKRATKEGSISLGAAERIMRLYDKPGTKLVITLIQYELTYESKYEGVRHVEIRIDSVMLIDLEQFDWHRLTLAESAKGELQVKTVGTVQINERGDKRDWLRQLYRWMIGYYDTEVRKGIKKLEQVQRRLDELGQV